MSRIAAPLVEGQRRASPGAASGRGLDRGLRVGLRGVLQHAEHVLVVVRLDDLDLRAAAGTSLPAADVRLEVVLLALELLELGLAAPPARGCPGRRSGSAR